MRSNLHYWQLVLCNCTHKRISHTDHTRCHTSISDMYDFTNISHTQNFTNRSHKDDTQASQTCMISQHITHDVTQATFHKQDCTQAKISHTHTHNASTLLFAVRLMHGKTLPMRSTLHYWQLVLCDCILQSCPQPNGSRY